MKLFNNPSEERPHLVGDGIQKIYFFDNGFGASVIRFKSGFPGLRNGYSSYTSNESEWELGVLKKSEDGWSLTYDTPITDDVLGHLSDKEVEKTLQKIKKLKETI